jgi:Integral peroxisomal membrane peroxin
MAPTTTTYASPSTPTATRDDANPPTTASFSPAQSISSYPRRNVLVHQNTPLLIATPPQVTRALAFSHPFLLPLNKFIGLLSWSSGDPWESFLLLAGFWAVVLWGSNIIIWTGPLMAVAGLMAGMYARRYSPLSTRGDDKSMTGHKSRGTEGSMRHQKSLDEIVETLNTFTARCNLMLNPLLELTDFLSTQQTATSATTRPALTTLFIRLLLTLPLWIALTLPPLRVITAQRVVLVVGTIFLTWHSRPARISRAILWRSLSVRYIVSLVTGLEFGHPTGEQSVAASLLGRRRSQSAMASSVASSKKGRLNGTVRFTFTVYENQRRWLGIGWTSSMFAYERAAWTDEHLNPAPPKERFQLPSVEGGAKWRWVPGSEWRTETLPAKDSKNGTPAKGGEKDRKAGSAPPKDTGGWIYYDNKWNDPKRQDGWNRYTRRRKWYRDAELVDIDADAEPGPEPNTPTRARADTVDSTKSAGTATSMETASTGGGGPTELPASLPGVENAPFKKTPTADSTMPTKKFSTDDTASLKKAPTAQSQLLSPTFTNVTTGADATDTDAASSGRKRRGLFHRRSRSREATPTPKSGPEPQRDAGPHDDEEHHLMRSREDEDDRASTEDEREREWLVGDEVRMGLG